VLDYKNVAMVNNPLVYWLSLTDGQLTKQQATSGKPQA
jgi:ATP-dependent helicase/DNAse subunit B